MQRVPIASMPLAACADAACGSTAPNASWHSSAKAARTKPGARNSCEGGSSGRDMPDS